MTVSLEGIDWISIIGGIFSVLGSLYLSFGVFGDSGARAVRPLLPAVLCAGSVLYVANSLRVLPRVVGDANWEPAPWMLASLVLIMFVVTYIITYRRQHRAPAKGYRVLFNRTLLISVAATLAVAAGIYAAGGWFQGVPLTPSSALVLAIPVSVLVTVYGLAIGSTALLTEDTMRKVGLILTLIGLFIRFLPPSLDLSHLIK